MDTSPHDMPPINVSFFISTLVGLLFSILLNTQPAFSGSTIINFGTFFENFANILQSNNDSEIESKSNTGQKGETISARNNVKISPYVWISGLITVIIALILIYSSIN